MSVSSSRTRTATGRADRRSGDGSCVLHVLPLQGDLDEPLARSPLVLIDQHAAQLDECGRDRLLKRIDHSTPIFDREAHDHSSALEGILEQRARRLTDQAREYLNIAVRDANARQIHASEVM
jgi:hypothetical protein